MKRVFLSLGSNIGDSMQQILTACSQIQALTFVQNFQQSALYDTTPVSNISQDNFINAACSFETSEEDPFKVLKSLQEIERLLGKVDKPKDAPRKMDIDILLFKNYWINTFKLSLPHPRMLERLFVLKPLCDLAESIFYPSKKGFGDWISLHSYIKSFQNPHQEVVRKISTTADLNV